MKKYKCNDKFFSLDDELSFYWAGFIAADGCLSNDRGNKKICIGLSRKDTEHLELFKKHIEFHGNICKLKTLEVDRIAISSLDNYNSLKRFGIIERKTKVYKMPEEIMNSKLINHFLRGYFDGDGSFHIDNRKSKRVVFGLRGTKGFLEQVLEIFRKTNIYDYDKKISHDTTHKIAFTGNVVCAKIRDFLYKDSSVCLLRKYKIVNQPFVKAINKNYKSIMATSIDTGYVLRFKKIKDVERLGFASYTVSRACKNKVIKRKNIYKGYTWEFIK